MQREMAFHVDSLARDYARDGLSNVDAQRAARRQFGNLTRLKERGHDERTMRLVEDVTRDIRHAARGLWRSPGFSLAVILTLALGIGGNTAVFSVVDQLLLRPLPYPDGNQLVVVEESVGANPHADVSPANWLDWQRESRTFRRFAAWRSWSFTLTGTGEPRRVNAQQVSSEFFPLLGVAPLLGRTISDEEDRPNGPRVAVLSYRAWQDQLGGDRRAIGRTVQLNDRPYEIVGVMPAGFRFIQQDVDLWTAFQLDRTRPWRDTEGRVIEVVGRLADGATIGTARSEMEGIARRLAATYAFNKNTSVTVTPLREVLTGQVRTSVLVLFAGVGVMLAIACFNVANMLLARSASRQREIAIRASLGAGRWAIARSVLLESLLLAGAGGALGLALARGSLDALLAVAPTNLLGVSELFIDRRVLIYAFGLSLATGAIAGLAPTVLFARRSMADALRTRGSKAGHAPRVRQALVVVQVAMTVVLLCGAGVLVRTLIALDRAPMGFDAHDVLTMRVAISPARYPDERCREFYREALTRVRALPGIESAAVAASLPMIGSPRGGTRFHELGTPERPASGRPSTVVRMVAPGYFRTLRIPVLRGREFTDADNANPMAGFVVNETFARRLPLGTRSARHVHFRPDAWRESVPADHRRRRRRQRRLGEGRAAADRVLQSRPHAVDDDDALRARDANPSRSSSRSPRHCTSSIRRWWSRTFARSRARWPRAWRANASARSSRRASASAVCCWRRSDSTVCSPISSPNGRRTSASASLLARGWHASQDRSSPAASRSSPSAPPSASPARCCSCGRSARCSSASRRTTSRRTRSSSCCWAPSPRSRPTCPRAAPRASSR